MTISLTRYADIPSGFVPDTLEAAHFTATERNFLLPTVTRLSAAGMQPRKSSVYGTLSTKAAAEGEDITPELMSRSADQTLTPSRVAAQVLLTDERIMTDPENARADAALLLGSAFAQKVDTDLVSNFASLTGGTIGTTGGTITLTSVSRAVATLRAGNVPGPYWCVLHPYQWQRVFEGAVANGANFVMAPAFQDRMIQNYFVTSILGDVTFVVTSNITVSSSNATGALYNSMAIAYDERDPFTIEPQRDASRGGWELNANVRYAHGVWRPMMGVQLVGLATMPS